VRIKAIDCNAAASSRRCAGRLRTTTASLVQGSISRDASPLFRNSCIGGELRCFDDAVCDVGSRFADVTTETISRKRFYVQSAAKCDDGGRSATATLRHHLGSVQWLNWPQSCGFEAAGSRTTLSGRGAEWSLGGPTNPHPQSILIH